MGQFLITARTEEGTKSESSLTSTEALSLRSRARSVSGPSAPADRASVQTAFPWSSTVSCQCVPAISRVAKLVAVSIAAPHALPGALGHGAAGADPGCGLLTQGAVLQAPIPQAGALAHLLSRGAEPGLMLIFHLGDIERLNNALQAPLLELGALKASQEPLDILRRSLVVASKHGKSPAIWSSLNW